MMSEDQKRKPDEVSVYLDMSIDRVSGGACEVMERYRFPPLAEEEQNWIRTHYREFFENAVNTGHTWDRDSHFVLLWAKMLGTIAAQHALNSGRDAVSTADLEYAAPKVKELACPQGSGRGREGVWCGN